MFPSQHPLQQKPEGQGQREKRWSWAASYCHSHFTERLSRRKGSYFIIVVGYEQDGGPSSHSTDTPTSGNGEASSEW